MIHRLVTSPLANLVHSHFHLPLHQHSNTPHISVAASPPSPSSPPPPTSHRALRSYEWLQPVLAARCMSAVAVGQLLLVPPMEPLPTELTDADGKAAAAAPTPSSALSPPLSTPSSSSSSFSPSSIPSSPLPPAILPRSRPPRRPSSTITQSHHGPVDPTALTSSRVYVGNLAFSVGWQDLKDFFRNSIGCVGRVEIIAYPSGRSKGCAVVEFDSVEEAGRAINELNNAEIHGRKIFIREDREGKGFGSAGRKGGGGAGEGEGGGGGGGGGGEGVGEGWGGMGGRRGAGPGAGAGAGPWVGGVPMYGGGQMGMMGGAAGVPLYPPDLYQLTCLYYQQLLQQHAMHPSSPLTHPPSPPAEPTVTPYPHADAVSHGPHGGAGAPLTSLPALSPLFSPLYPPRTFYPAPHPPPLLSFSSPPLSPSSTSPGSSGSSPSSSSPTPPTPSPSPSQLILSHLPLDLTWSQLMELTVPYGDVVWCQLVVDAATGRGVGVGLVRYATVEQAEVAMEAIRGMELEGKRVEVRKEDRMGGGTGGGMGGG